MSEDGYRSYYGRPVIKEPTWTWEIPCYFFTGGLAGAASVLSLGAKLAGRDKLSRTALYVGAVADAVSPALLVSDLGRPERFHHMLRVLKVTSPMNVGAWILLVSGGASNTAALLELLGRLKRVKPAAEVVAALAGPPLAAYTGVLVADTAVPVWHEGRHELPWLFGASVCAFLDPREAGPARRLAVAGVAAKGVAMHAMELRLGETGEVYHESAAGKLAWAAKGLAGAGAQIDDLLSAEQQLVEALPKMAQSASDDKLRSAFEEHLGETRDHVSRLEEIFGQIGRTPPGETCKAMKGLIAEGQEVIQATGDPAAKDAALIAAAQRVEHYEIAAYGTAKTLADQLGHGDAKSLLDQTLDEESNADTLLTKIATGGMMKSGVNQQAQR